MTCEQRGPRQELLAHLVSSSRSTTGREASEREQRAYGWLQTARRHERRGQRRRRGRGGQAAGVGGCGPHRDTVWLKIALPEFFKNLSLAK